jgi:glucokinase-like ROK family protein
MEKIKTITRATDAVGNAKLINRLNKINILNLIRDGKAATRAEAARISGLSAPTVTRLVESLINNEQLLLESGTGTSKGGRRPTILKFDGANSFVIGIDLGTTHIYGMLANLNAEIIAERETPTEIDRGSDDVLRRTAEIINDLCKRPEVAGKRIFGVGIAVAGLINRRKDIVEFSPDFHWHDVDVKGALGTCCDLPILFDNVTRMMAMGELLYGIGNKYRDFVFVNVGYGIGAGVVINREPLYGSYGMAGEFGHITLDKESQIQCACGNYGCLEALASGHSIALAARRQLEAGAESMLTDQCNGDLSGITAKMVADAAKTGETLSRNIIDEAAEYLGIGIASLVNLFSPHAVVIGGGVAQAGDILFDTVKKTVTTRSIKNISREVDILPATFGMKAAAMGAVSVVLDNVLHLNPIR